MHFRAVVAALAAVAVAAGCAGDDDSLGTLEIQVRASLFGADGEREITCDDARTRLRPGVTCGFVDRHRDVILFGPARPLNACRGGPATVRVTGTWRSRAVRRELLACAPGQGGAGAVLLAAVVHGGGDAEHAKGYVRCESAVPGAGWDALLKRGECTRRVLWRLDSRRRVPRSLEGCVQGWNRFAHTHRRLAARTLLPRGLDRVTVAVRPVDRPTGCVVRFGGDSRSVAFHGRWLGRELRWLARERPGPAAKGRPNTSVNETADLWMPR